MSTCVWVWLGQGFSRLADAGFWTIAVTCQGWYFLQLIIINIQQILDAFLFIGYWYSNLTCMLILQITWWYEISYNVFDLHAPILKQFCSFVSIISHWFLQENYTSWWNFPEWADPHVKTIVLICWAGWPRIHLSFSVSSSVLPW